MVLFFLNNSLASSIIYADSFNIGQFLPVLRISLYKARTFVLVGNVLETKDILGVILVIHSKLSSKK